MRLYSRMYLLFMYLNVHSIIHLRNQQVVIPSNMMPQVDFEYPFNNVSRKRKEPEPKDSQDILFEDILNDVVPQDKSQANKMAEVTKAGMIADKVADSIAATPDGTEITDMTKQSFMDMLNAGLAPGRSFGQKLRRKWNKVTE